MTAEHTTPAREQESTDEEPTLFHGERLRGDALAEVFVEPAPAATEINKTGGGVSVTLRQAEGCGLTVQWFMGASDAREFVDELGEAVEEIEAEES